MREIIQALCQITFLKNCAKMTGIFKHPCQLHESFLRRMEEGSWVITRSQVYSYLFTSTKTPSSRPTTTRHVRARHGGLSRHILWPDMRRCERRLNRFLPSSCIPPFFLLLLLPFLPFSHPPIHARMRVGTEWEDSFLVCRHGLPTSLHGVEKNKSIWCIVSSETRLFTLHRSGLEFDEPPRCRQVQPCPQHNRWRR